MDPPFQRRSVWNRKYREDFIETGVELGDLINKFLTSKNRLVDSRELSARTWAHYYQTCENLVGAFSRTRLVHTLKPEDFEKFRADHAKTLGTHAIAGVIQRTRTLFQFGLDNEIIENLVRFGSVFRKPSKKSMRIAKFESGDRTLGADELRRVLETAGTPMKAMVLLGLNCGDGQSDVANLPLRAIDLKTGWAIFPRPKTGVERRCPLWARRSKR